MKKIETDTIPWEIWVDIKWYEWLYMVSDLWRVKSMPRFVRRSYGWIWTKEVIIRKWLAKKRPPIVVLSQDNIRRTHSVSRLVACNFKFSVKDKEISFKDWNPWNVRLDNLFLQTGKERNHKMGIKQQKSVVQKDLDWNIVKIYKQWIYYIKWFNGAHIVWCCKWKLKTAYWYKREYLLPPNQTYDEPHQS